MTKRKRARKRHERHSGVVVTVSSGHEVECYPIIGLIDTINAQFEARLDELELPTYELEGVDGSSITRTYNDKTILGGNVSEEDKAAYTEYKIAANAIDNEAAMARLKAIAVRGSRVLTMPPEAEWLAEHEFLGLTVPEEPNERLWHYFWTDVVSSIQDSIALVGGVARASGANEEVIAAALASFQDKVGRPEGDDAPGDREVPEQEGPAAEQEGVDGEPEL